MHDGLFNQQNPEVPKSVQVLERLDLLCCDEAPRQGWLWDVDTKAAEIALQVSQIMNMTGHNSSS